MQVSSHRDADLEKAVRQKNVRAILNMMFEDNRPQLRPGFRVETEIWDYKKDCPHLGKSRSDNAWAELSKDILGFHNHKGGIIVFGVCDDFSFSGATQRLDSKQFNDQVRKYLGDRIWIEYHREFIQADQRYLGIAIIPPRGATFERFIADAPVINGKQLFTKRGASIRENDSTRVLSTDEADKYEQNLTLPTIGKAYEIDEPFYRILSPDYTRFVDRPEHSHVIESSLQDRRYAITSLVGIGGAGKTALATWATLRAFRARVFDFIISITAKDRELTASGIQSLKSRLTSFESLLDNILTVLEFPDLKSESIEKKEDAVRNIIENSNGLLYVDNLETVDDIRIISFLDNLPEGVKALTTSRRARVRVSVKPIEIGSLSESEVTSFIKSLVSLPGKGFIADLSQAECLRIGDACDRLPLGIKWILSKSSSPGESLNEAESITKSGRKGEELLEFCFRRVFDTMPGTEKSILQVLSLYNRTLPLEAVLAGTGLKSSIAKVQDAIDQLVEDALVQRRFDPQLNDYCYSLLPITKAFVERQVSKETELQGKMMRRLSDYYEATDITDRTQRLVVREIRQGIQAQESSLIDLAIAAERRKDFDTAESLYENALQRNPGSWQAARKYAEFKRHKRNDFSAAIKLYEQAGANAPSRGADRSLIFREWGMLLKDSGLPDATDQAIEKFGESLKESPNDQVAQCALAQMYDRKGRYQDVIRLMEPLVNHEDDKTRSYVFSLLQKAYERTNEMLKLQDLKIKMEEQSY